MLFDSEERRGRKKGRRVTTLDGCDWLNEVEL